MILLEGGCINWTLLPWTLSCLGHLCPLESGNSKDCFGRITTPLPPKQISVKTFSVAVGLYVNTWHRMLGDQHLLRILV
ncbi:hypothetical protein BKA82DRAFT_508862 [Pisolithus tinctorius]|uniref:Uncharacterized protein n=1 Tax=Pisolithus tinctorius Marx 270 TaxID=870435 RepID=A0A0C3PDR3_PISTI|nr:hypothetical protein BKA82DRAFT_508862 [Pisolithus tinctorius]KIO05934.1 hypothetical protein M404DRAFT_508862 [Pisolithus tinctorius Marx 270]